MKRYLTTKFKLSSVLIYGIIIIILCILTSCYSTKYDGTFTINNNCSSPIRYYFSMSGDSYCNCFSTNRPIFQDSLIIDDIKKESLFDNVYVLPDSSQTLFYHDLPSFIIPYNFLSTHDCLVVYREYGNLDEKIVYKKKIRHRKLWKKGGVININFKTTVKKIRLIN